MIATHLTKVILTTLRLITEPEFGIVYLGGVDQTKLLLNSITTKYNIKFINCSITQRYKNQTHFHFVDKLNKFESYEYKNIITFRVASLTYMWFLHPAQVYMSCLYQTFYLKQNVIIILYTRTRCQCIDSKSYILLCPR